MNVPKVTVNIINQPPKDKIDDVGAEMRVQAIDFDSARGRIVVTVTVWSKTSRDAREVESTFRVPLPVDLRQTLQEVIDSALNEVRNTLVFPKTTGRE
jgi:hypothetical protein